MNKLDLDVEDFGPNQTTAVPIPQVLAPDEVLMPDEVL
jgi:hypothetical protein